MHCPLCHAGVGSPFAGAHGRRYFRCPECGLVFLDPAHRPSSAAERAHYGTHENDPADPGYRRFLSRMAGPLLARLPAGAEGLDYGSGPGPALPRMLEERGFRVRSYDPYFAPDPSALERTYHFITATEVVEHFFRPRDEFDRLDGLLRPGGWLGVMTEVLREGRDFSTWRYARDPTHVCFYAPETLEWIARHYGWTATWPHPNVVLFQKPAPPRTPMPGGAGVADPAGIPSSVDPAPPAPARMNPIVRTFCRAGPVPLALRRQVARALVPFSDQAFTIDIDGVTYRGRLDSYLEWMVWVTGRFFEYTYLNLIRFFRLGRDGGTAVDVGANVGNHALAFSTMFDQVIAVEPYEPIFRRLEAKVEGRPNVQIHQVGLGARAGTAGFEAPSGRNTGTGHIAEDGPVTVRVEQGDEFLARHATGPIRFIKVDVEGYEAEVLRGLAGTLEAHRPVVFYESFRTAGLPRAEAMSSSFRLFPQGYEFWGLRGQTTFPVQREIARPVRLGPSNLGRRYAYVLACPRELGLLDDRAR